MLGRIFLNGFPIRASPTPNKTQTVTYLGERSDYLYICLTFPSSLIIYSAILQQLLRIPALVLGPEDMKLYT